jgi:hypothetical protein
MAKTFYYDSVDLLNSTLNDGTFSGSAFSDSDSMTNENLIIDQSISSTVSMTNAESVKFTISSSEVDFVALYFTAAESDNITFARGVASNIFTSLVDITDSFSVGWNVSTFSSATATDFYLNSTSGTISNFSEIIFGKKLEFEINPDIGIGENEIFGTEINTSVGGVEYAIKKHEPKTIFSMSFSNISETFKNNLQTFEGHVQNFKKFIYSEDGTTGPFYYVRLDSPIEIQEVAFNRYSASFSLTEQLS